VQTQIVGTFDTLCLKFFWAILINVVVVFMIYAIMNTLSSTGLPGRQRLPESSSFKVTLKVDPTVVTNQDRFDRPETITDICQGLGWWMEGDLNHSFESLTPFTRPHLSRLLNFSFSVVVLPSVYSSSDPSSVCSPFFSSILPSSFLAG